MSKSKKIPVEVRQAVFQRSDHHCEYCGQDFAATIDAWRFMITDHIQPLSKGGSSDIENLAAGCTQCNNLKWDYAPVGETRAEKLADATKYIIERRKEEQSRWESFRASVRERDDVEAKRQNSNLIVPPGTFKD